MLIDGKCTYVRGSTDHIAVTLIPALKCEVKLAVIDRVIACDLIGERNA